MLSCLTRYRLYAPVLIIILTILVGCASASPPASDTTTDTEPTTDATVTIWTFFNDQNPQNDSDRWLATTLNELQTDLAINITNVHQSYAHINSQLQLAVSSGGDVPDVAYMNSQQLGFHLNHGTLEDITDYVRAAPWYDDLDPLALQACTGPDGRIYCVPGHIYSRFTFYWKEHWPQGFPADTESFLSEAARLREQGTYAMTFKGSEVASAESFYFGLIYSFGGRYADEEGTATWASPETVRAIDVVRTLLQNSYAPDVVLATGFDHERVFTDGSAAAFSGGSWSMIYLHPLTAPGGTRYDAGSGSVPAALEAGDLGLAHYLAAPGSEPVTLITVPSWAIPKGSPHPEQARRFLDAVMTPARNADYALATGGVPALQTAQEDPRFQTEYWRFVRDNQQQYGVMMPPLKDYDRAITMLSETINRLIMTPDLDSLSELQVTQDTYNATQ